MRFLRDHLQCQQRQVSTAGIFANCLLVCRMQMYPVQRFDAALHRHRAPTTRAERPHQ
jgi:hypothetical protein